MAGLKKPKPVEHHHNLTQVESLAGRLRRTLERSGSQLTGEQFDQLVAQVKEVLPTSVPRRAVYESLRHLAGQRTTREQLHATAHLLAGNLPLLRKGNPVHPWSFQHKAEWVPVQITSARLGKHNDKVGWHFGVQILAGSPAGLRISKFWNNNFCRFISRELGFKRRPPVNSRTLQPVIRQFRHPTEFVQLRFSALLDPELCERSDRGLDFQKIKVRVAERKWNQRKMDQRDRVLPGHSCPIGKTAEQLLCFKCPLGYLPSDSQRCEAATHGYPWQAYDCPSCKQRAWRDPVVSERECVSCARKSALRARSV